MKSILGPIQLNGLTIVKSKPFSAPSAEKMIKCNLAFWNGEEKVQNHKHYLIIHGSKSNHIRVEIIF